MNTAETIKTVARLEVAGAGGNAVLELLEAEVGEHGVHAFGVLLDEKYVGHISVDPRGRKYCMDGSYHRAAGTDRIPNSRFYRMWRFWWSRPATLAARILKRHAAVFAARG